MFTANKCAAVGVIGTDTVHCAKKNLPKSVYQVLTTQLSCVTSGDITGSLHSALLLGEYYMSVFCVMALLKQVNTHSAVHIYVNVDVMSTVQHQTGRVIASVVLADGVCLCLFGASAYPTCQLMNETVIISSLGGIFNTEMFDVRRSSLCDNTISLISKHS